jgi:hypothetical protein
MTRICGPTCPNSILLIHANAALGPKPLISKQNQAILTSNGRPLGECRLMQLYPSYDLCFPAMSLPEIHHPTTCTRKVS